MFRIIAIALTLIMMPCSSYADDKAAMHKGLVKGCLQGGDSLVFCNCMADGMTSNVPMDEMATFVKLMAQYFQKQVSASQVPVNYHMAFIDMAACGEKYGK